MSNQHHCSSVLLDARSNQYQNAFTNSLLSTEKFCDASSSSIFPAMEQTSVEVVLLQPHSKLD